MTAKRLQLQPARSLHTSPKVCGHAAGLYSGRSRCLRGDGTVLHVRGGGDNE